jgi:hypothetical protein
MRSLGPVPNMTMTIIDAIERLMINAENVHLSRFDDGNVQ